MLSSAVISPGFTEFTAWLDVKRATRDLSYSDIPCVGTADPKLSFVLFHLRWDGDGSSTSGCSRPVYFLFVKTNKNIPAVIIQKYGHNDSKGFLTLNTPRASGFTGPFIAELRGLHQHFRIKENVKGFILGTLNRIGFFFFFFNYWGNKTSHVKQ